MDVQKDIVLSNLFEIDAFSNVKDINHAFDKIDLELTKYAEIMLALRMHRNKITPISKLPTEMLAEIFIYCALLSNNCLLNVTHVCHRWRTVALECSNLWTYSIPSSDLYWAIESLHRSKGLPLRAYFDFSKGGCTPVFTDLVPEHIPRIKELFLAAEAFRLTELLKILDKPTPLLEDLTLEAVDTGRYGVHCSITPWHFCAGEAPQLRRLSLKNCVPQRWSSIFFKGLTHLSVDSIPRKYRPMVPEILGLLKSTPLLKSLYLSGAIKMADNSEQTLIHDYGPPVELVHLLDLRLRSSVFECGIFLNNIVMPDAARIRVWCKSSRHRDMNINNLMETFQKAEVGTTPLVSCKLDCPVGTELRVRCWEKHNFAGTPKIDFHIKWYNSSYLITLRDLPCVCKALMPRSLHTLEITVHPGPIPWNIWLKAFAHLVQLRKMVVWCFTQDLLTSLSMDMEDPPESGNAKQKKPMVFLPGLRNLEFRRMSFRGLFEDLCQLLMDRFERGNEIRRLCLYRCHTIDLEEISRLKEIVVNVKWQKRYGEAEADKQFESDTNDESLGSAP